VVNGTFSEFMSVSHPRSASHSWNAPAYRRSDSKHPHSKEKSGVHAVPASEYREKPV
jgi:hypothetical protein